MKVSEDTVYVPEWMPFYLFNTQGMGDLTLQTSFLDLCKVNTKIQGRQKHYCLEIKRKGLGQV